MKEIEIKLIKGASFSKGDLKFVKGQTKFVHPDLAKQLVATERFIYTAEERGKDAIICPYCKKTFEITKELILKATSKVEMNSDDGVITMDRIENKEAKEFNEEVIKEESKVCPFCLRKEGEFKSPDLETHIKRCKSNPVNITKKKKAKA